MKFTKLAIFATLLTMASTTFAATQAANATSVAPTMTVSATIQKAVSLTLSTGATGGVSHCAVAAGGNPPDYTMNFGTVDALGINAGNCNKFNPATPGTSDAVYWSDYQLLPVYTSHQTFGSTTVTAQVTTDFGAPHNIFIVRDSANSSTVPASAASMTAMGTGSADTIGAAGVVSGTALTRFIGVEVKPTNGATVLQGAQTATVTFTLTVQ
ncbi:MAG: hypothetical protein JOZ10_05595 [Acidobacteria bacterium]|nr:hypothetical protein [Acidobacteriota bacterium]MBV9144406.1 hypothetical protein [Acidobacteriota bacterium]